MSETIPTVTILDYGLCNLLSVVRAFRYVGAEVVVTESPGDVDKATRLVLPGVGAFADGMKGLRDKGLIAPIQKYAAANRPLLGICLGMQMMLETNEEFGRHEGLGLIPGRVSAIPLTTSEGKPHKSPHIGWNSLKIPAAAKADRWRGTILSEVPVEAPVYFVHSFTAIPVDPVHRLADCDYNGRLISAAVQSGKLFGCQFHPEKSGLTGLQIIKSFTKS